MDKDNQKDMKKLKGIANVFFCLTLISPMIAFALASIIGEAHVFGVAGIVRYSWVMLFFVPFGIFSIIVGIKLKKSNQKFKKHVVIALICLPLLIVFGSYRFVFSTVTYDASKIVAVSEETHLDLPTQVKIATNQFEAYSVSYAKITDEEVKESFETEIESNQLWQEELSNEIKGLLPLDIQLEVEADIFDYFVFYNKTDNNYNQYPLDGEYEGIFIAYDAKLQRLLILDGYKIIID